MGTFVVDESDAFTVSGIGVVMTELHANGEYVCSIGVLDRISHTGRPVVGIRFYNIRLNQFHWSMRRNPLGYYHYAVRFAFCAMSFVMQWGALHMALLSLKCCGHNSMLP